MRHTARSRLFLLFFGVCLLGAVAAHSLDRRLRATAPEGNEEGPGEKRELTFRIINFVLLAGGLGFLLRKPLSAFFTQRSASIQKSLEQGRKALEASQAQLNAVQEKLWRLEEEIQAFKASAALEIHAERERIQKETAEEAQKILDSARAQMETATRAARIELRSYAAEQAVKLAEQMIRQRLDDSGRRRLVSRFVQGLRN